MTDQSSHLEDYDTTRVERLEARIPKHVKDLLKYAANLSGLSVTDYLIMVIQKGAETTIREHDIITLSARDSAAFAEALLNPGEPNDALREAFARHKKEVISR
jgi:uncharacterized protein (DUF1778 family)